MEKNCGHFIDFYTQRLFWFSGILTRTVLSCHICRLPSLKEIVGDVERAFVELQSCWEEEKFSKEEKCKNVNAIRQELLV
jgi:hypothetical protein